MPAEVRADPVQVESAGHADGQGRAVPLQPRGLAEPQVEPLLAHLGRQRGPHRGHDFHIVLLHVRFLSAHASRGYQNSPVPQFSCAARPSRGRRAASFADAYRRGLLASIELAADCQIVTMLAMLSKVVGTGRRPENPLALPRRWNTRSIPLHTPPPQPSIAHRAAGGRAWKNCLAVPCPPSLNTEKQGDSFKDSPCPPCPWLELTTEARRARRRGI